MKTLLGIEFKPKDPIQYDDELLKRLACSHIEQDTFINRDGSEEKRCKACKTFESDMPTHWGINEGHELAGGNL